MKTVILFSLMLFTACDKELQLKSQNGLNYLEDVSTEIKKSKNVEWEVGKTREKVVSKGIQLNINVPRISFDSQQRLQSVNSWIYKFTKVTRKEKRHLGYISIPFKTIIKSERLFTIHLFYHAASISKYFRNFHCPAFEHRLKVVDYEVVSRQQPNRKDLYVRNMGSIVGKVTKTYSTPLIFSTGIDLKGEYLIDVALYDARAKKRFSKWIPLENKLVVNSEEKVTVPSCIGVKEEYNPLRQSRQPNIKDLEIPK